jgi:hypothetical protein
LNGEADLSLALGKTFYVILVVKQGWAENNPAD